MTISDPTVKLFFLLAFAVCVIAALVQEQLKKYLKTQYPLIYHRYYEIDGIPFLTRIYATREFGKFLYGNEYRDFSDARLNTLIARSRVAGAAVLICLMAFMFEIAFFLLLQNGQI